MTSPDEDPLRHLPSHDVRPALAEALRRRAHALLAERQRGRGRRRMVSWSACYHGVVEPATLILLGLGYFALRVQATVALFQ